MITLEEKYNVSRETIDRLKSYEASLVEWQQRFNLVSNSSLPVAWERHFLDSLQLLKLLPKGAKTLLDVGSGAGFPGMVLAIAGMDRTPYLNVTLVESIKKKTLYLKEVANITGVKVNVVNDRIEKIENKKYDVITSRALASLDMLLDYIYHFCHANTVCIFPKGKSYKEELKKAEKRYEFDLRLIPSEQSDEGMILVLTNVRFKRR